MKAVLKLFLFTSLFFSFSQTGKAQLTPFENWTSTSGTQNFFVKSKTVTDGSGNVYVAGATVNGNGNYDMLVSKFNSGGVLQWSQQKDGLAGFQDGATALFVDGSGNVYITGFIADTLAHGTDVITIKYNSGGTQQWIARYNGVGNLHDFGADLHVDGSGNVYVVGSSYGTSNGANFLVMKYNSSGVKLWRNIYNYSVTNLDEAAFRIKSVTSGKITVAGVIQLNSNTYAYGHLSYNTSTGTINGSLAMGSSSTDIAREFAYTQDSDGNTYLAGAINNGPGNGLDYCIIKFDTSAAIIWESHYDGPDGLEDVATDVIIDGDGNVYATGYTTTSTEATNFTTVKFDPTGNQIWERHYNGAGNGADSAMAMILRSNTTFVITGSSFNGANQDYYTIKYDTTGAELWKKNYNGPDNLSDGAHSIAIDNSGGIIITGQSHTNTAINYTTVKYEESDPYLPMDFDSEDPGYVDYLENKGQLLKTDLDPADEISYYSQTDYPNLFIKNTRCSFVFHSIDTTEATDDTVDRIDMRFIEANGDTKIKPFETGEPDYNFFLPHIENGIIGVKGSKRLIVPDLYLKTDLHYSSNENGLKIYFIIRPGGNPASIKFKLDDATDTYINGDGTLTFHSILDSLVLDEPVFYQDSLSILVPRTGGGYQATANPDEYIFNVPAYNASYPLIIQIDKGNAAAGGSMSQWNNTWSTFVGGTGSESYEEVAKDTFENILACGASSSINFPLAGSTIQTNPLGLSLAVISKFDRADGSLDYSTFFGGTTPQCGSSANSAAKSIAADASNNIYVSGYTVASDLPIGNSVGGPILQSVNNSSSGSCQDLFILSLSPLGNFQRFSTYWGGDDDDIPYALYVDSTDHLQIGGNTQSSDFPVTDLYAYPGTYYSTVGDGFLMDLLPNGDTAWVTLFPGRVRDIAIANDNRIFITGEIDISFKDSLPVHKPYSVSYCDSLMGGNGDSYAACFNATKEIEWCTFIGGTSHSGSQSADFGRAIAYHNGQIVIAGVTWSARFKPLLGNASEYLDTLFDFGTYSQDGDLTITKFNAKDMQLLWSTLYGGDDQDHAYDVAFDKNNNIYVIGMTGSPTSSFVLDNYSGSWYDTFRSDTEGFILAFNNLNQRFWCTYFGGDGVNGDYPNSLTTTQYDQLFVAGSSTSTGGSSYSMFPIIFWNSQNWLDGTLSGSSDATMTLFDISDFPLSISEQEAVASGFNFGLYPNPNNGNFNLLFNKSYAGEIKISVFNQLGQSLFQKDVRNAMQGNIVEINVNNLATGIYLVSVETAEGLFTSKIIVR